MDSLIIANLRQRPTRTLVSVAGVALGVVLILVNTGLVRGIMNDRMRRERNIGAEIQFTRRGSQSGPFSPASVLPLDVRYVDRLLKISGVRAVTPVGRYIKSSSSGIGVEQVDGIDFDSYAAISGLRLVEGRPFQSDDEVIIDEFKAQKFKLGVGNEIQVFGKQMKVVGVYTPESGPRIKMSLAALQRAQGAPNKCTVIMVRCEDADKQVEVLQRIEAELPGNIVVLTRDIVTGFERAIPGLDGFIKIILALSIVVSTLIILLAMYTTITERTREIGILKSLGAPKRYIIAVIEKEALTISLLGVVIGLLAAFIAGWSIERLTSLQLEYQWSWVVVAALIGLIAGAAGAFYPAIRAANQDPVKALSYE
jgi:putative ABC transport system permease protein